MSLEANKIAAAILVGGMLTLSSGLIANMIYGGHEGAEHGGGEAAAPAAPAAKPASVEPISGLLASADAAAGDRAKLRHEESLFASRCAFGCGCDHHLYAMPPDSSMLVNWRLNFPPPSMKPDQPVLLSSIFT